MKKKEIKKSKTYSENHTGVLLEEINSKIDLILEEHSSLKVDINKMDVRLSKIEDKIVFDSIKISNIDFKLESIKRDIKDSYKSASEYFSQVEKEIQSMKKEANELKKGLKSKVELEKILSFEKRLLKMEKLLLARNS